MKTTSLRLQINRKNILSFIKLRKSSVLAERRVGGVKWCFVVFVTEEYFGFIFIYRRS